MIQSWMNKCVHTRHALRHLIRWVHLTNAWPPFISKVAFICICRRDLGWELIMSTSAPSSILAIPMTCHHWLLFKGRAFQTIRWLSPLINKRKSDSVFLKRTWGLLKFLLKSQNYNKRTCHLQKYLVQQWFSFTKKQRWYNTMISA